MKTLVDIATAMGVSKQAVAQRANRESWSFEEQSVRGGKKRLYPVANLPADVRSALQGKAIAAALPVIAQEIAAPIILQAASGDMTDAQRLERDARNGIKAAISRTMVMGNCSQEAALQTLLSNARTGMLDPITTRMLQLARDKRGRKGENDDGFPSTRSLKRWLAAQDLTPKVRQQSMAVPPWAKAFLFYYQQPQKPSVANAYDQFSREYSDGDLPTIHQVRRFLDKLGTVTRERGRMGQRELKNIQPFVRRDFSLLQPNDVWSADGHTFDAEVQHPFHGRPFRPEITTFVDIATRRAVGWSVDLAESSMAVADALRYAVERNGIPAILYVDNGSGYKNSFMEDEEKGLLGRLCISPEHSLPYNSQARGVIERFHQTCWVDGAKLLPSYMGASMDREARLQQFKLTRKALKQGGAMPLMPWELFVQWCEQRVADYNAKVHRSLGGITPDLSLEAFKAKGWEPEIITAEEIATLFRPRVSRKLARAEIRLFNNIYFARELEEFHGIEAHVAYDIHDPSRIWVYLPDGRLICEAEVNGNSKHYFPVPVVEQARQKRAKGRLNKVDAKRQEILEELHGGPALAAPASDQIVIGGKIVERETISAKASAQTIKEARHFQARSDEIVIENVGLANLPPKQPRSERPAAENHSEWLELKDRAANGEELSRIDAKFIQSWPESNQGRVYLKRIGATQ